MTFFVGGERPSVRVRSQAYNAKANHPYIDKRATYIFSIARRRQYNLKSRKMNSVCMMS